MEAVGLRMLLLTDQLNLLSLDRLQVGYVSTTITAESTKKLH